MLPFSLATLALDGRDQAAVVVDGRHYRLDRLIHAMPAVGLRGLMNDWDGLIERLSSLVKSLAGDRSRDEAFVPEPSILAPLRYPNKLICVGAVYSDHLAQFNLPAERWPRMPIFLRPPTTSIVGPGRTIQIPPTTRQFDWEIEMAVIIGRRLTDGTEEQAKAAIAGYSIGIDFSCRDLLDVGSRAGVDLVRAKAQDGMAPLGPTILPAQFVQDPQSLSLRLWVNDKLKQDSTTRNMLYSVYEQISTISKFITLEPGDVVFTGSPAGSAGTEGEYLKVGDLVCAEIEGMGSLRLEIVESKRARA
jgi:2-keto-4-pentenoate hydratase/2-oxohepta-3-ene-1,7-dioic acid hydratase in catechol pathway